MDLGVPEFVIIDTDDKTISTTKSSTETRSTTFSDVQKHDGLIYLQGVEGGRAFSFVIDEASGRMTVAVSRDGMSISVFGACTDADL
jgi:6-phosphogluconolactonase (cycloisomerase 2 family)